MITRFNDFRIPDVNSVSKEFWKMTTVANWKLVVAKYHKNSMMSHLIYKDLLLGAKKRICKKYTYDEFMAFEKDYQKIYYQLYDDFEDISESGYVGDDGYGDLLASIIGCGKMFTKKCIYDHKLVLEIAKKNGYVEGFQYLFNISKNEFDEIKKQVDPLFRDTTKYNV